MKKLFLTLLFVIVAFKVQSQAVADISYRLVPQSEMKTFMDNEAMYWGKIFAVLKEQGHVQGWSINTKAGGGLASEPNVYSRIGFKSMLQREEAWKHWSAAVQKVESEMDPEKLALLKEKLKQDKFEFASVLVQGVDQVWAKNSDWKFLVHNYTKTSNPAKLLELESKITKPFFEKLMKQGKTKQKGWVTSYVLSPQGYGYAYNVMTVDFFENFSDIYNAFDGNVTWPEQMTELNDLKENKGFWKRSIYYRAIYLDSNNEVVRN